MAGAKANVVVAASGKSRAGLVSILPGSDAAWAEGVVRACPSLQRGCRPPLWARNGHVQAMLSVLLDDGARDLSWDEEERIRAPDGGTVSLQWAGLEADAHTPVLVVLHTICGSGHALRRFVASMRKRLGWTVVACNRRGHAGLPLTVPRINTMGSVEDLKVQLDRIVERRPGAALYGVGVSAGSGLLVRYLGEARGQSRFAAAVAVCPAYDLPDGLREAHAWYDAYLARRMSRYFLDAHREVLAAVPGFESCREARSMVEFQQRLYRLAGFETREAYEEACDPMRVVREVETPCLVLNSEDDPVCSIVNVERHRAVMETLPRVFTAVTRFGGHCGFFEAMAADASWSDQAIAEYLTEIESRSEC